MQATTLLSASCTVASTNSGPFARAQALKTVRPTPPTTTFQTFPFPEGLTPDIPAASYANDPRAIAQAARRLVRRRNRWLNPPEWVDWIDEPAPNYPKRPVPTPTAPVRQLRRRTPTNLYNDPRP